jgi:adenylate cyclase
MFPNRQLAAIMFTDIEGYTAIMQRDEQKAILLKNRHREILKREHELNNGRVIQFYGDGTLSIFHSAVQAVQCALQMQKEFRDDPSVPVRIGLHVGDIIFDDNQVFGDGVNLASRVESLSVPGAVLISDRVNDEIINHPEFNTVSLGIYKLKNIERSVEIFALDHPDLIVPLQNSLQGKTDNKKNLPPPKNPISPRFKNSIAVLPFLNMSNDPDQDYFGEGVAEEILNSLSTLKQLKVAGRASSFQFHGKRADLKEIGQKLGVATVLEGSIRKQSNRVRVTVQLINIDNGFQLWSERYDRDMDDIFAIQDEIALSITEKLKLTLFEHDRKKITKNATSNTEAYELYLKGRFYVNRRGGAIITSIKYFQLALELDPAYALAHSGFADANLMAASYGLMDPLEAGPKAKEAAETAIRLNPALCEPYCSLAFYHTSCDWNFKEAKRNFLKCLELNPSYSQAHSWYGLNFSAWAMGDFITAEKHGRKAIELEPLSSICYGLLGPILHIQGKYAETVATCRKGLELDPYAFICNFYFGWAHISLKKYKEGIEIFEKIIKISNGHHFVQAALCIAYKLNGEEEKAVRLYYELKEKSKREYVACTLIGLAAAYLGNIEEALVYLEKGFDSRDPILLSVKHERWVTPELRAHPYFTQLLEQIGFPEKVEQ